jgi:outer membrane protein assembly factor BamB
VAGKAYIGGGKADYTGVLAVIDIAAMAVQTAVDAPAPVQASPLVSTAYATPHVYYTANTMPGALYVYSGAAAGTLFTPAAADQNYCMASAVAGSDGTLYYTNDSGKLFAVKNAAPEDPADPIDPVDPAEPACLFLTWLKTARHWLRTAATWLLTLPAALVVLLVQQTKG